MSTFRDQAREVLTWLTKGDGWTVDRALDQLEALPARDIERDAMEQNDALGQALVLERAKLAAVEALCDEWAGLVNARLTPDFVSREVRAAMRGGSVDGVVLSPEEVRRVLLWFGEGGSSARDVTLAERLEKEAGQ